MNAILRSSKNPENLSLTIKGLLVALVPIIIMIFAKVGFIIAQEELLTLISQIFGVVSSVMIVWGGIRKIYIRNKK